MKIGSLFSGAGIGLHGLGDLLWGVEYDPSIAAVYKMNFPHSQIICEDIANVDPSRLPDVDLLVATPPCTNASIANRTGMESENDVISALATVKFIKNKLPKIFVLENVSGYKYFESFQVITRLLDDLGYYSNSQILNLKDFGIAQNRERVYLMAVKNNLFLDIHGAGKSQGWYGAIWDLIPSLPKTNLLSWQKSTGNALIRRVGATSSNNRAYHFNEVAFTIRALGRKASNHWEQANVNMYEEGRKLVTRAVTPAACLRFFGDKETADSIKLPYDHKSLSMEVVGNGCSWEMLQILVKHLESAII